MDQSTLLVAAGVSAFIGFALGFLVCAMATGGKAAGLLDEIDELKDKLFSETGHRLAAEAERDQAKARLARLTDRDGRGRFVKGEA